MSAPAMRSLDLETSNALLDKVGSYYSGKILRYGPTPLGVDWRCQPSQYLRFIQLLRICNTDDRFRLNDLGCGYGALCAFIAWRHPEWDVDYLGTDISSAMVEVATRHWQGHPRAAFAPATQGTRPADYSIASGIFNICLGFSARTWRRHVAGVLRHLDATSIRGFSVNFMRSRHERDRAHGGLYQTSSLVWRHFCELELGSQVEIVEDYGLREFTLLARRPSPPATFCNRRTSAAKSGS